MCVKNITKCIDIILRFRRNISWINSIGWPNVLIFIGIILTALNGIWSAYESNKTNFELKQSSEKFESLSKKVNDNLTSAESFVI